MKTLFISDLHLDPKRPDIQDCFDQFINSCIKDSKQIGALYILGDLFEVWIGDDASIAFYQHTIKQLKDLRLNGIKVFIMHGNRDFLLASEFEKTTACTLISDPYLLKIKNEKILLSHGDSFCIDDTEYMQFRNTVRDPLWQNEFLSKTIKERKAIAQSMRESSRRKDSQEYRKIDVSQEAIKTMMLEYDVQTIIHGHTHRPDTHYFRLNNLPAKRIVLPDWTPDAEVFIIESI